MRQPTMPCAVRGSRVLHVGQEDGTFLCDGCGAQATCRVCSVPVTLDHPRHLDGVNLDDTFGTFYDRSHQPATLPGGAVTWPCGITAPHEGHAGTVAVHYGRGGLRGYILGRCPGARQMSMAGLVHAVRRIGLPVEHGPVSARVTGLYASPVGKVCAAVWCEFADPATAAEVAWMVVAELSSSTYIVSPPTYVHEDGRVVPTFTVQATALL